MSKEGGAKKKFYLLGTDYVFPRTAEQDAQGVLLAKGVPASNIVEEYTPFGHQDYQTIVGKIKEFAAGGERVRPLDDQRRLERAVLQGVRQPGPDVRECPVIAFSVAEDELRGMDTAALVGHLAAGTTSSRSTRRRTRSSSQTSRPTAEEQPARRRRSASPTTRSKPPTSASTSGSRRPSRPALRRRQGPPGRLRAGVPGARAARRRWTRRTTTYEAGPHRRDPRGRPVQGRLAHEGSGHGGALEQVREGLQGEDRRLDVAEHHGQ